MSFSDNWGHLKNNMAKLREKIDRKQHNAKSYNSPAKVHAAGRNRKRMSLVALRNKEMAGVRIIAAGMLIAAIALLYYLNS
ncbi:MAG TPA: hypothetical protein DCG19_10495 [Cryomorphaceae bacterium]|nr:hypothetical protein [Owenweeksia sp.]MBG00009.1 hypothetical protein [Owenweeksia sp.]HAD97826.1 hypothetical protein [Cryomorphaceae bacterium]HBF18765.1 hypothetical protein [Cryomorphaceae bacterium]HCQ15075.1 hypothetical protein [Cryomorphaceae bacterium]|tara:strand:- start:250 stop:492 length:243 start_codon:yes stop_codon:yes gene_type:complete